MASIINKIHGALMKPIRSASKAVSGVTTGPATYAWRALILRNRATSAKAQHVASIGEIDPALKTPNTSISATKQRERQVKIKVPKGIVLNKPTVNTVRNNITIINPQAKAGGDSYEAIVIQGKPSEVNISTDNTWVTIKSPGRNNPLYNYMGSEDTIDFEISWYALESNRTDVIKKCRLLESWSKANGYESAPPELWISWGSAEMFRDDTFILVSAPYVLSNFQNACRSTRDSEIQDLGLLPNVATQKLTFKRTTKENLSHASIQRVKGDVPKSLPSSPLKIENAPKPEKFER